MAGLAEIPCIVRQLTDDEATIIMVDSNLQREQILPSEKAFAYKMKLDAMKRQAGRPSKENGATVLPHFSGKKSREILAEQSGESHEQIRKYIRLTHLIPEILELVDKSVLKDQEMLQIAMRQRWSCPTCEKKNRPTCSLSWTRWTAPHPTPRPSKCARCPKPRLEGNGWPKTHSFPL